MCTSMRAETLIFVAVCQSFRNQYMFQGAFLDPAQQADCSTISRLPTQGLGVLYNPATLEPMTQPVVILPELMAPLDLSPVMTDLWAPSRCFVAQSPSFPNTLHCSDVSRINVCDAHEIPSPRAQRREVFHLGDT